MIAKGTVMFKKLGVIGFSLVLLLAGRAGVFAQDLPRQLSDDDVKLAILVTCQKGPERTGKFGRQVAQTLMDLGWRRINAGDPYGAAEAFYSAANAGPERPDAYWGLGVAAHVAGLGDHFLQACFGRVQNLLPDEPGPWADHGRALEERGETDEAILRFLEALKRDPDFTPAHIGLVQAYDQAGNRAQAEHHARRVQELTRAR